MLSPPRIRIILNSPEQPRNVGSALRVAANFGLSAVTIVTADCMSDQDLKEIRIASSGASELIQLQKSATLREALVGADYVVGTSGRNRTSAIPISHSLSKLLPSNIGILALVFGRESTGLTSTELSLCDAQLRIPLSPQFPSMNLSHAVAVVLWEATRGHLLNNATLPTDQPEQAVSRDLKERWLDRLDQTPAITTQMRHLLQKARPTSDDMALLFNLVKKCQHERK